MPRKKQDSAWVDEQVLLLIQYFKQQRGTAPSSIEVRELRKFVESGERELVAPMTQTDKDNHQ